MTSQAQTFAGATSAARLAQRGQPVSRILLDDGALPAPVMLGAMAEASRLDCPLSRILEAEGLLPLPDILEAEARRHGVPYLRPAINPPDERALRILPAAFCLEHAVLPWCFQDGRILLATARPDDFAQVLTCLPTDTPPVEMAIAAEADIHTIIAKRHGEALAREAETLRPADTSCRDLAQARSATVRLALVALAGFGAALAVAPVLFFASALAMALLSLVIAQGLKVAALFATMRRPLHAAPVVKLPAKPPTVTLLVPLYREGTIAPALITRLSRLTYPKALLDVILILEETDTETRSALADQPLPRWVRAISVPAGDPMTKPRALNFALRFARGTVVGIFDAEDSPAPDQIDRIVATFADAPAHVACLQGVLDFYNPRSNWLSRCFAIEYASWFRIMLPGLVRLGFAVPLGGTTVFFRREALDAVGGWDAHNVTEDADLGMLLARRGYETHLVPTVTREEANNRFWPWIKQRSRWLKGYAITWWVHSRRPRALWQDLGPKRFLGLQALFLTTLVQFTLAPVLWSFWLIVFGLPHPLDGVLSTDAQHVLVAAFLSAEAVSLTLGIAALARSPHRRLIPWVPTLFLYFPLGSFAIYKALWEVLSKPFFWDKTEHGHSSPDAPGADLPPV